MMTEQQPSLCPSRPNRIGHAWLLILATGGILVFVALCSLPQATAHSSPGTNAVGCCRAYCSAQSMYHRRDWDGDGKREYAESFGKLHNTTDPSGEPIRLIDEAFAGATRTGPPKHCYRFEDLKTIAGDPIDRKSDYALCAAPASYGPNRRHVLIVKTDGRVWARDFGESRFVTDFPANPIREKWRPADEVSFDEEGDAKVRRFFAFLIISGTLVAAFMIRAAWWAARAVLGKGHQ